MTTRPFSTTLHVPLPPRSLPTVIANPCPCLQEPVVTKDVMTPTLIPNMTQTPIPLRTLHGSSSTSIVRLLLVLGLLPLPSLKSRLVKTETVMNVIITPTTSLITQLHHLLIIRAPHRLQRPQQTVFSSLSTYMIPMLVIHQTTVIPLGQPLFLPFLPFLATLTWIPTPRSRVTIRKNIQICSLPFPDS
jgi:hypothetical protein